MAANDAARIAARSADAAAPRGEKRWTRSDEPAPDHADHRRRDRGLRARRRRLPARPVRPRLVHADARRRRPLHGERAGAQADRRAAGRDRAVLLQRLHVHERRRLHGVPQRIARRRDRRDADALRFGALLVRPAVHQGADDGGADPVAPRPAVLALPGRARRLDLGRADPGDARDQRPRIRRAAPTNGASSTGRSRPTRTRPSPTRTWSRARTSPIGTTIRRCASCPGTWTRATASAITR